MSQMVILHNVLPANQVTRQSAAQTATVNTPEVSTVCLARYQSDATDRQKSCTSDLSFLLDAEEVTCPNCGYVFDTRYYFGLCGLDVDQNRETQH